MSGPSNYDASPPPHDPTEATLRVNFSGDSLDDTSPAVYLRRDSNEGHPEDPTYLRSPEVDYRASTDGSVVPDGGNSSRLVKTTRARTHVNGNEDLIGLGAHLQDPLSVAPSSINEDLRRPQAEELGELIYRNLKAGPDGVKFLPNDIRDKIITRSKIKTELERLDLGPNIDSVSAKVCEKVSLQRNGTTVMTSRQAIFTLLCMVQKAPLIRDFIEEDLYDYDLPFIFKGHAGDVYRKTESGTEIPINVFKKLSWNSMCRQSFDTNQGAIYPTYFLMSYPPDEVVREYRLKDGVSLPFLESELQNSIEDISYESLVRYGGFSVVRRVYIHPAHYEGGPEMRSDKPIYFAVKELIIREGKATYEEAASTNSEAAALKKLNAVNHKHLIRLLATYVQHGRVHMIFPWADGNLEKLWRETPRPAIESPENPALVRWMSEQILGLAQGLMEIHYCKADNPSIQGPNSQKQFGRHGDLKPQNILWFKEDMNMGEVDKNILKIADFGFADFRSQHSKSNVPKSRVLGTTPTYEPPEYSTARKVSPHYDIWSFGCILLQFVVWYLQGWEGIEEFSIRRAADQRVGMGTLAHDNFFTFSSFEPRLTAQMKKSVLEEFENLKKNPKCSDYLLDLLEYVKSHLLKMNPNMRADIKDIVNHFKDLNKRCQESEYGTERTRKYTPRSATGLSELAEEIDLNNAQISTTSSIQNATDIGTNAQSTQNPTYMARQSADVKDHRNTQVSFELNRNSVHGLPVSSLLQGDQHPSISNRIIGSNPSASYETLTNDEATVSGNQETMKQSELSNPSESKTMNLDELDTQKPIMHSSETKVTPAKRAGYDTSNTENAEHNVTASPTRYFYDSESADESEETARTDLLTKSARRG